MLPVKPVILPPGRARDERSRCPLSHPTEHGDVSPGSAEPWLPVPAEWARHAADLQATDPGSTLSLYRRAIALRSLHPALGSGLASVTRTGDVIRVDLLARHDGPAPVTCWINMGSAAVEVPAHRLLLASSPDVADPAGGTLTLAPDTAVWTHG